MRPHRRQPTRLPRPWDSPGKNTGVGCHFLFQRVKVKSLSCVRLFKTPWTAAYQAPPSMRFSEYWSAVLLPSPRGILSPVLFHVFLSFSSVQLLSCVRLCDPISHTCQASLSITSSWSPPKLMSIESVMPSNHLILCRPLLLLPSIFPSIRVFSNESVLHIRWPKYWSFSFTSVLPMNTQD